MKRQARLVLAKHLSSEYDSYKSIFKKTNDQTLKRKGFEQALYKRGCPNGQKAYKGFLYIITPQSEAKENHKEITLLFTGKSKTGKH